MLIRIMAQTFTLGQAKWACEVLQHIIAITTLSVMLCSVVTAITVNAITTIITSTITVIDNQII